MALSTFITALEQLEALAPAVEDELRRFNGSPQFHVRQGHGDEQGETLHLYPSLGDLLVTATQGSDGEERLVARFDLQPTFKRWAKLTNGNAKLSLEYKGKKMTPASVTFNSTGEKPQPLPEDFRDVPSFLVPATLLAKACG